jgi:histidinol-phosphate aminotransferase
MNVNSLVRKPIIQMDRIQWGETKYDESFLILKWGENPFPTSPKVIKAISNSLSNLNSYPSLNIKELLRDKLGIYAGVKAENVLLTNGSDKAFRLISETFVDVDDEAIVFNPTFPVFSSSIKMMGGKIVPIPLNSNYEISSFEDIQTSISKRTKIIYICNPNNPTGNYTTSIEIIEKILELGLIVIVDEAYFEFGGISTVKLLEEYNNLIILRSFSKTFGLAGLRVAYLLASSEIINMLSRIEDSIETFNITTPSLVGALSILKNMDEALYSIKRLNEMRKQYSNKLQKLNLKVINSSTTFVLFSLENQKISASDFMKEMAFNKIILKDLSIYDGLSKFDVYSAIPAPKDLERVLDAINNSIIKLKQNVKTENI